MLENPHPDKAADLRRLCYVTLGFLRQPRLRRILNLSGYSPVFGIPAATDAMAVWGRSKHAQRGEAVARWRGAPLLRIEDAFLRSVRPGRAGDPPLGIIIDPIGVHFDGHAPSLLENILNHADLDDPTLLSRAKAGIERLRAMDLSKYNVHAPCAPCPAPGYVLLIDQTKGDASLRYSGAAPLVFDQMLAAAMTEHPNKRIVIKSHPETNLNLRKGHFGQGHGYELITAAVSPWALLSGAVAVYTVSSQMGFEAILAGHRPRVFGLPFYAGWGLSDDELAAPRRTRPLTAPQLFAAAMFLAPTWYDPCRDQLCSFEQAVDQLEAETRSYREDFAGHTAIGMRLWKRDRLQKFFGRYKPLQFSGTGSAPDNAKPLLVWAGKMPHLAHAGTIRRVEDGFLRSRGLGAELVPPLSLVADDLGIYYDPCSPSRLEALISAPLPPGGETRARALINAILHSGLSKYNLGGASLPKLPHGRRILIPGQVEDDASIQCGAGEIRTNLGLVKAVRSANPDAILIYKPHPDVEAGLRPGKIDPATLAPLVHHIAEQADPIALIDAVESIWTITSLLGFEALIRGKAVTCLGAPFYAGWGLTHDLGPVPQRRLYRPDGTAQPRPTVEALAHATLIAYPRYYDPLSGLPCPPEVALERLRSGGIAQRTHAQRILAKVQGLLASHAGLWR